jgi:hypothetical protein
MTGGSNQIVSVVSLHQLTSSLWRPAIYGTDGELDFHLLSFVTDIAYNTGTIITR